MRSIAIVGAFAVAGFQFPLTGLAAVTFSLGAGSAVSTADRQATFDSLTTSGNDLSAYQEGMLSITVPDINFVGFDPFSDGSFDQFHYGSGGNNDFVTIQGTDLAVMIGLEFKIGDGFTDFGPITLMAWETYLNGILTGSGSSIPVPRGGVVGWSDLSGFDELRVGATHPSFVTYNLGDFQAIALDNVRVELADGAVVPEASSFMVWALLGMAICAAGSWHARNRALVGHLA